MKHSEWKITSQYINDKKMYAVYRLIDVDAVDHSGNREYGSGYLESRASAAKIADELNNKT